MHCVRCTQPMLWAAPSWLTMLPGCCLLLQARIEERAAARQAKDFERADKVRLELADKGLVIMDTPQGTTWRPALPRV